MADLAEGKQIHAQIVANELEKDVVVESALLNIYGKCGSLHDAISIFEKIDVKDDMPWSSIITAYAQCGHPQQSLQVWISKVMKPTPITFASVCDAICLWQRGISKDLAEGKRVHADIVKVGLEHNRVLGNILVEMYCKCGSVRDATWAFESIHEPNVFSWTILIAAHAHNGYCRQALQILCQMQLENMVTFSSVLSGCANQGGLTEGKTLHGHLVESRFKLDIALENTLINMYAKCGCLDDARRVFNKMKQKNVVSWTSMITAYAWDDQGKESLELYSRISLEGVRPDEVTFISVLDSYACVGALSQGMAIHFFIVACGYNSHVVVATTLVNLYGKCGTLEDTRNVFDKMKFKNVVSWNAMITA